MDLTMNAAQQIFVVFFAIFWGTSANAWPKWKPFHWTLVPFSGRVRLRLALSFIVLNLIPVLYFIWILRQLGGSIPPNSFSTFWSASKIVVPAIVPAFATFGLYRLWIALVEFCPGRFYYKDDAEMANDIKRNVVHGEETRLDPTIESLNLKDWTWWPNLLFALLYLLVAAVVPFAWPPVR